MKKANSYIHSNQLSYNVESCINYFNNANLTNNTKVIDLVVNNKEDKI